jgi:hypothetical protein
MRRILCLIAFFAVTAAVATFVNPPSVKAITYGYVDTNNTYSNTGAFIVKSPSTGQIYPICTGTLVAGDVFLTASHCTAYFTSDLAPRGFAAFVSFDKSIPFGSLTSKKTRLIAVTEVVTNPNYNPSQNDSGDIAVLRVSARDTRGIAPAALPTAGLLDVLASQNGLQGAKFTAAGYGLQNRVVGGGVPYFQDANPIPRMYSFSSFSALNTHYLRLSQNPATGNGGTCFGDSGGPNFFTIDGTQIIAGITITGDSVCQSTNVTYRLDTASARQFLDPYVALP